jgi:hypothetical protein
MLVAMAPSTTAQHIDAKWDKYLDKLAEAEQGAGPAGL